MSKFIRGILAASLLAVLPLAANAAVFVSVSFAPPVLPVYVAPPMPAPGYFWTPGYWSWAGGGYFWVPGTWVLTPAPGVLWTPGYWGWAGGAYIWHGGYWGPHVGFYGGVNYGFGYGGVGFHGGSWVGGRYVANTTIINNTTVVNNSNRVSYNGGSGGVVANPTAAEARAAREQHMEPSQMQLDHQAAASRDITMRASYNHGTPQVAAAQKAGVFYGHGVVAARAGGTGGSAHGAYPATTHGQSAQPGGYPGGQAAHGAHPAGSYAGGHGAPGNSHPQARNAGSAERGGERGGQREHLR